MLSFFLIVWALQFSCFGFRAWSQSPPPPPFFFSHQTEQNKSDLSLTRPRTLPCLVTFSIPGPYLPLEVQSSILHTQVLSSSFLDCLPSYNIQSDWAQVLLTCLPQHTDLPLL
ncbi:hypothetical protein B0T20DRAFT_187045 [Sordaria brevicollis]|uniref:Secreted protein n=1 Tax=Sordaria brevicollis TaxID=83679 RepID=A0AAE0PFS5_SORBR|nr:hypothetical protein B0T20DRAFT_187045 [Sordaria brevicollis]